MLPSTRLSVVAAKVRVVVPPLEAEPGSDREHDPLTPWQARVIATHQTGIDWRTGLATLAVPTVVADLLQRDC
jgi:hypothetical protein